jgi:Caspase domain
MAEAREGKGIENTASSTVELEPPTEYTRFATKSDIYSNGVIRLISKAHDISLVDEHISSIKHLAADLDKAVKAVWPRRQDLRYTQVQVLLIRWEDDDLGVVTEVQELKHVFQHIYNYSVETYDIPSVMPQRTLNRRIQEFLKYDERNGDETLLIVYYAGHASRVPDSNEPPLWFA